MLSTTPLLHSFYVVIIVALTYVYSRQSINFSTVSVPSNICYALTLAKVKPLRYPFRNVYCGVEINFSITRTFVGYRIPASQKITSNNVISLPYAPLSRLHRVVILQYTTTLYLSNGRSAACIS